MDKSKAEYLTYILGGLIALAIGTLTADAIIHLIPAGLNLHNHGEEEGHEGHNHGPTEQLTIEQVIWRGCVCIAGAYFIYLVENLFHLFGPNHSHEPLKLVESANKLNANSFSYAADNDIAYTNGSDDENPDDQKGNVKKSSMSL
eukprot:Pgem_evm1s10411